MDTLESRPLPETEEGYLPFWSPDSRSIGFFARASLMRMDLAGGPVRTLCPAEVGRGGSWGTRGVILYAHARGAGLKRIPAAGGPPSDVLQENVAGDGVTYTAPHFLPDGNSFLYRARSLSGSVDAVLLSSLDAPTEQRQLLASASAAVYAPRQRTGWFGNSPGHVIFVQGGSVMAQTFDVSSRELLRDPFVLATQSRNTVGMAALSASTNGTVVYESGQGGVSLVWRERNGSQVEAFSSSGSGLGSPSLSPDGTRIAYGRLETANNWDIWVKDRARGTDSRFTVKPGADIYAVWSATGEDIVYSSVTGLNLQLYRRSASGAGEPEKLTDLQTSPRPTDWSSDGQFVLFHTGGQFDLMAMQISGEKKIFPVVATPFTEMQGRFSPGGQGPPKWFAYVSDESGTQQVYVQAFVPGSPASGARTQISTNGGTEPRWRRDGKELYYLSFDGKMIAVPVKPDGTRFEAGTPVSLFATTARPFAPGGWSYDVSRDGQRFLLLEPGSSQSDPITVIVNWEAALKQ
jgi:hypothetical protein